MYFKIHDSLQLGSLDKRVLSITFVLLQFCMNDNYVSALPIHSSSQFKASEDVLRLIILQLREANKPGKGDFTTP